MLDVSYLVDKSAGKEAVFVVDADRLSTVIQNAPGSRTSLDRSTNFTN